MQIYQNIFSGGSLLPGHSVVESILIPFIKLIPAEKPSYGPGQLDILQRGSGTADGVSSGNTLGSDRISGYDPVPLRYIPPDFKTLYRISGERKKVVSVQPQPMYRQIDRQAQFDQVLPIDFLPARCIFMFVHFQQRIQGMYTKRGYL